MIGIASDIQDNLIKKIESGELIDSMNPKMKDKGKIEKEKKVDKNGEIKYWKTKITYPDGSVSLQTVTPEFIFRGSGYVYYEYALVSDNIGVYEASYRADFTLVDGAYDHISDVYEYLIQVNLGSYNLHFCDIDVANESYESRARGRLQFDFTLTQDMVTHTVIIYLFVGQDSFSSSVVSTL